MEIFQLTLIVAVLVYLLGVQLPTVTINVPLNNTVQTLEIDGMDNTAREAVRGTPCSCRNVTRPTMSRPGPQAVGGPSLPASSNRKTATNSFPE